MNSIWLRKNHVYLVHENQVFEKLLNNFFKKVDFQFEEMHDHGVTNFCEDMNESTLEEKVDLDSYFAFNFLFAYFLWFHRSGWQ